MPLGCTQTVQKANTDVSAFKFDEEAFPDAKPWTSEDFKNNPEIFQFAIIRNRTRGANAQGTFKMAMDQINLLQPEYVINVGDFIEGYSDDKGKLNEMQEEAEGFSKTLEDPEAAKKMLEEYMTSEAVVAALGQPVEFPDKQLAWIKNTLAENTDVRWTFLFMHEPCWENPSESFKSIEKMLADRDYTMFGGHLHYYDYDNINGHEYITMGPAGPSFHHDGPGNVDHIMWVTMTEDGPQMGNIALKGLFDRKGLDPELFGAYDRKGY
ncbi:MAG: hypothetical protein AMS23_03985 [Bacteroides sp. SM1_62]|nr:MAG: hypothetical protein AMS26_11910 [Bacteroides sp. SM23_62]KPL25925.1 MAG: hypothetical protein AMS23_03985 [Bacteroides sp. SM1_62]